MRTFLRRVKGAAVNALFWGGVWFWLGAGASLMVGLAGGLAQGGVSLLFHTLMAGSFAAIVGAAIGGCFSLFIATAFRHRHVDNLSPWRFALAGGLVTAAAMLATRYAFGSDSLIDHALLDPLSLYVTLAMQMLVAGAVGGLTAFGTIKLAQRGAELERLDAGDGHLALEAGNVPAGS